MTQVYDFWCNWYFEAIDLPSPSWMAPYKACPYFLFLRPKPKWWQSHDILFTTTRLGWNQLCLIVDKLTMTFHDLKTILKKRKINKGIGIMRTEEVFIIEEYGMEMLSHRYLISSRKYVFSLLLSILVKLFSFATKLHLLVFLFMHF